MGWISTSVRSQSCEFTATYLGKKEIAMIYVQVFLIISITILLLKWVTRLTCCSFLGEVSRTFLRSGCHSLRTEQGINHAGRRRIFQFFRELQRSVLTTCQLLLRSDQCQRRADPEGKRSITCYRYHGRLRTGHASVADPALSKPFIIHRPGAQAGEKSLQKCAAFAALSFSFESVQGRHV